MKPDVSWQEPDRWDCSNSCGLDNALHRHEADARERADWDGQQVKLAGFTGGELGTTSLRCAHPSPKGPEGKLVRYPLLTISLMSTILG